MAGAALESFCPNSAAGVLVACTTTSGSTRVALVGSSNSLLVQSLSTSPSPAFIEFGSSTVTAAVTTGLLVQPGVVMVLKKPPGATHVAGITAATTASVYVTTGDGD